MQRSLVQEVNDLHSQLCGALADPKRILILYALNGKALNVSEITQSLQVPQPTVSRHLKTLRERGLVITERKAQSIYYRLADPRVIEALDILRTVLADMLADQGSLAQSAAQASSRLLISKEKSL
jgi:DNA-binding transcriptional ArsR family regulator